MQNTDQHTITERSPVLH